MNNNYRFDTRSELHEIGDTTADALAAIALIAIFVATCIFWVSGQ